MFGVPQHRLRLYVLCVPLSFLDMSVDEAFAFCQRGMGILVGSQMQQLADYILPESHAAVARHLLSMRAKERVASGDVDACLGSTWGLLPGAPASRPLQKKANWPRRHMQVFREAGLDWASEQLEPDAFV